MLSNLADEPMDEEAERRAFAEAVAEWRNMGKVESKSAVADSMWSNPLMDSSSAVSETVTNPKSEISAEASLGAGISSTISNGKGSLADGMLDEEKERAV